MQAVAPYSRRPTGSQRRPGSPVQRHSSPARRIAPASPPILVDAAPGLLQLSFCACPNEVTRLVPLRRLTGLGERADDGAVGANLLSAGGVWSSQRGGRVPLVSCWCRVLGLTLNYRASRPLSLPPLRLGLEGLSGTQCAPALSRRRGRTLVGGAVSRGAPWLDHRALRV